MVCSFYTLFFLFAFNGDAESVFNVRCDSSSKIVDPNIDPFCDLNIDPILDRVLFSKFDSVIDPIFGLNC